MSAFIRSIRALAAGVALCVSRNAPSQIPNQRIFHLTDRGGARLPQTLATVGGTTTMLSAATLVLFGDGRYKSTSYLRRKARGRSAHVDTVVAIGTYRESRDSVTLIEPKVGRRATFGFADRGQTLIGPGIPAASLGTAELVIYVYRR